MKRQPSKLKLVKPARKAKRSSASSLSTSKRTAKPAASKKPARRSGKGAAQAKGSKREVTEWISIPQDVVLSPQSEAPRHVRGQDRSTPRKSFTELSWVSFDSLVQELAREVRVTFKPAAVVGVAHGGVFVGGAIASALKCEFFPVRISRRSRDHSVRPQLSGEMPAELKRRKVLIVDDVASSGDTLELAKVLAKKVGASEVKTAVLVGREEGYRADWTGLATDELVVFPWDYEPLTEDSRFDVDPDKAGA